MLRSPAPGSTARPDDHLLHKPTQPQPSLPFQASRITPQISCRTRIDTTMSDALHESTTPPATATPHFSRLHPQKQPQSGTGSNSNPAWAVSLICIVIRPWTDSTLTLKPHSRRAALRPATLDHRRGLFTISCPLHHNYGAQCRQTNDHHPPTTQRFTAAGCWPGAVSGH